MLQIQTICSIFFVLAKKTKAVFKQKLTNTITPTTMGLIKTVIFIAV